MQHDYSIFTQRVFAGIFGLFALVGPVIGVTYSDSFGVRYQINLIESKRTVTQDKSLDNYESFFCSDWAGKCTEKQLMEQVHKLIN